MRTGDVFVLNLDKLLPDLYLNFYRDESLWPADLIYDARKWRQEKNYMRIVKDEENIDLLGNKKMYSMHEKF